MGRHRCPIVEVIVMGKYHRTTITVPLELKARMDAVEEEVSWSAVACRAFEQKLAEIVSRKGALDMKDVILRLRASLQKTGTSRHQEGYREGRRWAGQAAEAVELERLDKLRKRCTEHEWATLWSADHSNAYGPGEQFVFAIRPDDDEDRQAADDFWADFWDADEIEARTNDSDFMGGFVEGALDLWDEVADEL